MNKKNPLFPLLFSLFFASFAWSAAHAASLPPSEKWFLIMIADQPVGYIHDVSSTKNTPDGEMFLYSSDMKMVLNRLGSKVEMRFVTGYEETAAGLLKKISYEMRASLMATKTEASVTDKTIEFRSESGGKVYARTIPYSGALLGQEGIRLVSRRNLKKPGDSVKFLSFMPELEAVSMGSRKVLAAETLRLDGKDFPALKVEELIEATSIKSTAWLDADYEVIKQEMPTPFGLGVFVLADKARALEAVEGTGLSAELFARSIIRSNIRPSKARALEYLKVRLTHKNPELGWPEIKSPYQTVSAKDRETLILEIKRPPLPKAAAFPVPANETNREFLSANAYIQSDEPRVQALARDVIGGEKDAFKAALKLERWVSENMTFDLGIALAPSSEIFQNRRGTCLGYATLLATMVRAAGIPSRVVMGYVYVLGMFGGHAWTEILIGDAWIPIDAAIVAPDEADAARLYFNAVSLYSGAGSLSGGAGQQLLGQVDIKILEYAGAGGKRVIVPEDAVSYRITGDTYENPWLGLTLKKPADFKFTGLDAVWPDPALISLEGPDGAKIEIQQFYLSPWKEFDKTAGEIIGKLKIAAVTEISKWNGLPMFSAAEQAKAAMVIIDQPEAWVLVAEGKDAPKLLDLVASGLKMRGRTT